LVDWDEEIKVHLFWVWGGEEGFFKRGKEGMLVVTDKRLAFISKTDMTYRIHDIHSTRQLKRFEAGENIFRPAEGYSLDVLSEEKDWGTILKVKVNLGDKARISKFSIVKGWIKYPAKDPFQFQRVDWSPLINLVKTSM
jgi:hypothetical protein